MKFSPLAAFFGACFKHKYGFCDSICDQTTGFDELFCQWAVREKLKPKNLIPEKAFRFLGNALNDVIPHEAAADLGREIPR